MQIISTILQRLCVFNFSAPHNPADAGAMYRVAAPDGGEGRIENGEWKI
jgi:hypothetical protein